MRPGNPSAQQRPAGGNGGRAPQQPSPAMAAAMSGAVDLAAVKARSEAQARAAEAPPPSASSAVIDVDEASFQAEVIDRSFQVPVLLDLWAEWCQPCKQLSPILEKLATEAAGAWVLAKIDVDANPRIQQALQVQGIPAVFAVIGGQVVPGFQGALPEAQVREFVGAVQQAAEQAGLSGAGVPAASDEAQPGVEAETPEEPSDPRFAAAEQALEAGDYDTAVATYQGVLDVEPANTEASLALRQVRFLQRVDAVTDDQLARAGSDPSDVDSQLAAADHDLAGNQVEAAFARLLTLLKRVHGEDRDPVRDRLVDYFDLLGPDDPRVPQARRDLANALF